jgi:hypothetical protein
MCSSIFDLNRSVSHLKVLPKEFSSLFLDHFPFMRPIYGDVYDCRMDARNLLSISEGDALL